MLEELIIVLLQFNSRALKVLMLKQLGFLSNSETLKHQSRNKQKNETEKGKIIKYI